MNSIRLLLLLLPTAALLLPACSAHMQLEPVGKGRVATNASIGGPIVEAFGTHIPVPYAMAGGSYGLSHDVDLAGSLHLLSLAYSVAGLDVGATWYPLVGRRWTPDDGADPGPYVGIGGKLMMLASFKEGVEDRFRIYPILSSSIAWDLGSGKIYGGIDATISLTDLDFDLEAPSVRLSPLIGYRWDFGRRARVRLYTELKWQAANVASDRVSAEYTGIAGYGALAPLVGIEWLPRSLELESDPLEVSP